MIQHLLEQLTALTNLCEHDSDCYWTIWDADLTRWTQIMSHPSQEQLNAIQGWVQREIVRRKLSCILQRTSHSDWEAGIAIAKTLSNEPAIALLMAFIEYLQHEQNVNSALGKGGEA